MYRVGRGPQFLKLFLGQQPTNSFGDENRDYWGQTGKPCRKIPAPFVLLLDEVSCKMKRLSLYFTTPACPKQLCAMLLVKNWHSTHRLVTVSSLYIPQTSCEISLGDHFLQIPFANINAPAEHSPLTMWLQKMNSWREKSAWMGFDRTAIMRAFELLLSNTWINPNRDTQCCKHNCLCQQPITITATQNGVTPNNLMKCHPSYLTLIPIYSSHIISITILYPTSTYSHDFPTPSPSTMISVQHYIR